MMDLMVESLGKFFIRFGIFCAILITIASIFFPEFREPSKYYTCEKTIVLGCLMTLVSKLNDIHKTIEEIKEEIKK